MTTEQDLLHKYNAKSLYDIDLQDLVLESKNLNDEKKKYPKDSIESKVLEGLNWDIFNVINDICKHLEIDVL